MPYQFRSRLYTATYEVTRSFGWDLKNDFTLAATVNRAVYQINPPPTTEAQTVSDFVSQAVPLSDTRVVDRRPQLRAETGLDQEHLQRRGDRGAYENDE